MTYIDIKTRGDVYGNVKTIVNDAISVIPWMIQDSLKCAAIKHKQSISNNQLIDKEEAEADKSEMEFLLVHSILGYLLLSSVEPCGIPPLKLVK